MTDARFPDPGDPYEDEGLPGTDNALPGKQITGDPQDDIAVPGDTPLAVDDYGTTAEEQAAGEPLDLRLSREEPDVLDAVDSDPRDEIDSDEPFPADREERVGRIVEPDEGARSDDEPTMVGYDADTDGGGFSAEERAMHIEPGASAG
ncbi:MAG: DUF5709 domain-containing protein [Frankiaceae bacterium]